MTSSVSKNSKFPLDGLDIHLLRLFCIIVECNGFSAAQARTNISAASISSKLSALESRLGLKPCRCGRAGFKLTTEGQSVYEASVSMFQSHNAFVRGVGELQETDRPTRYRRRRHHRDQSANGAVRCRRISYSRCSMPTNPERMV